MPKDESVVKSFRISGDQFEKANEIFKKEGFSLSEVIRLVCDATIREGRIPRGLSTKEMEPKLDDSQTREAYIDSILGMVGVVPVKNRGLSPEARLMKTLFNEGETSSDMSNSELREWAEKWGLPDELSIATLAELHDSDIFKGEPWDGEYDAWIEPVKPCSAEPYNALKDALIIVEMQNNIKSNWEKIKNKCQVKAIRYVMEMNNLADKTEKEDGNDV